MTPSPATSAPPSAFASPVVVSESVLRALTAIRHERLLPEMFGTVVVAKSVAEAVGGLWPTFPDWLAIRPDPPAVELPPRITRVAGSDRATLQLAVSLNASLVLIDGKSLIEKVKLSYIKAMGTVPIVVQAFREGRVKNAKALLTALERAGCAMPPPEQMDALLRAIDELA